MRGYGQFCPIAKGERWTNLIILVDFFHHSAKFLIRSFGKRIAIHGALP